MLLDCQYQLTGNPDKQKGLLAGLHIKPLSQFFFMRMPLIKNIY
jgi:hypothetical protein